MRGWSSSGSAPRCRAHPRGALSLEREHHGAAHFGHTEREAQEAARRRRRDASRPRAPSPRAPRQPPGRCAPFQSRTRRAREGSRRRTRFRFEASRAAPRAPLEGVLLETVSANQGESTARGQVPAEHMAELFTERGRRASSSRRLVHAHRSVTQTEPPRDWRSRLTALGEHSQCGRDEPCLFGRPPSQGARTISGSASANAARNEEYAEGRCGDAGSARLKGRLHNLLGPFVPQLEAECSLRHAPHRWARRAYRWRKDPRVFGPLGGGKCPAGASLRGAKAFASAFLWPLPGGPPPGRCPGGGANGQGPTEPDWIALTLKPYDGPTRQGYILRSNGASVDVASTTRTHIYAMTTSAW